MSDLKSSPPEGTGKPIDPARQAALNVEASAAIRARARRKAQAEAHKEEAVPPPKKPTFLDKFGEGLGALFSQGRVSEENVPDPQDTLRRYYRMMSLIWWQGIGVLVLVFLLILGIPILQPYYRYVAVSPENERVPLVSLDRPNLTDRALLSWATTSITEIMTLGFGDIDKQLMAQRSRFTSEGWTSFLRAVVKDEFRNTFKANQLILTTVPSDSPVIVAQGPDTMGDGEYQWVIEMPIIMNFVTNNNAKKQQRSIVRLTITRVPAHVSVRGIAIKSWQMV